MSWFTVSKVLLLLYIPQTHLFLQNPNMTCCHLCNDQNCVNPTLGRMIYLSTSTFLLLLCLRETLSLAPSELQAHLFSKVKNPTVNTSQSDSWKKKLRWQCYLLSCFCDSHGALPQTGLMEQLWICLTSDANCHQPSDVPRVSSFTWTVQS